MPEQDSPLQTMFFEIPGETRIAYELAGTPASGAAPLIVWGHGWRQSRAAFKAMIQSLPNYPHLLIDFPGFGESPLASRPWGVKDYAEATAKLLASQKQNRKLIWVGHSFGGRVGIRLAIDHPELIDGLFLIGSHGLKPKRNLINTLEYKGKVYAFKTLKHLAPVFGLDVEKLRAQFGSADYRAAGGMRETFLKVIADDLTAEAPKVRCPARLIYGELDRETPPEMGERLAHLIPRSDLIILPGLDHYSVIGEGRHPVIKRLNDFAGGLA